MRFAVLLFGQPRQYEEGYKNLSTFLSQQTNVEVDFFYHCWTLNQGEVFSNSPYRKISQEELICTTGVQEALLALYKPVSYEYEFTKEFDVTPYKTTLAYKNTLSNPIKIKNCKNVLSQIYSRNKVRTLFAEYVQKKQIQYDYVCMTRFDLMFLPSVQLANVDPSKVYVSDLYAPRRKILPDIFILMPQSVCIQWFTLHDDLKKIIDTPSLLKEIKKLGETIDINTEELILAKYILEFKSVKDIVYHSGMHILL
jgi:hypothetical protein